MRDVSQKFRDMLQSLFEFSLAQGSSVKRQIGKEVITFQPPRTWTELGSGLHHPSHLYNHCMWVVFQSTPN